MWVGGEGLGEEASVSSGFLRMVYGWGWGVGTRTRDGEMEWAANSAEGGDPPPSHVPPPCPTLLTVSTRQGRCKETVNSGAASSLSLVRSESSDRAPVPPLPFSQVVLETQACWLESGGSLGPCPPPPLHHPAKPGTSPALAQAKQGSHRPGQGGAEPCSAPWSGPSPWEDEDGSLGLWDWAEPLWTLQWVGFP